MRVAVFSPRFCTGARGGIHKGAGLVANLFARNAHEVHIVCFRDGLTEPAYPLDDNVTLKPTHIDSEELNDLGQNGYDAIVVFGSRETFWRLNRIVRIIEAPLILQECFNPIFTASLFLSDPRYSCKDSTDAFWLRQAMLAHCSAIRFVHPSYAASVVVDAQPFTYSAYNPAGEEGDEIKLPAPFEGDGERKFVCVEALRERSKNGMAAVHAFCRFAQEKPGWSLHLYGRNAFAAELQDVRGRYPQAQIVDHGIVKDIRDIYADAYALIIPSYEIEGMPNVLIEAFCFGVPCIGFADCPGVSDAITHGKNGLLADRTDPEGLRRVLSQISEPALRNALGSHAHEFAQVNFRYSTWAKTWLQMLRNAVGGLDNNEAPRLPAPRTPTHPRASKWRTLMECHFPSQRLACPFTMQDSAIARRCARA